MNADTLFRCGGGVIESMKEKVSEITIIVIVPVDI